jgi:hypothetical protein
LGGRLKNSARRYPCQVGHGGSCAGEAKVRSSWGQD